MWYASFKAKDGIPEEVIADSHRKSGIEHHSTHAHDSLSPAPPAAGGAVPVVQEEDRPALPRTVDTCDFRSVCSNRLRPSHAVSSRAMLRMLIARRRHGQPLAMRMAALAAQRAEPAR